MLQHLPGPPYSSCSLNQLLWDGKPGRQIDFTLSYPQADAEYQLYMDIPKGFKVPEGNENYCLKVLKNIN